MPMTALLDFKNEGLIGSFLCEKLLQASHLCGMWRLEDWQECKMGVKECID